MGLHGMLERHYLISICEPVVNHLEAADLFGEANTRAEKKNAVFLYEPTFRRNISPPSSG
jgi:hypothetical protein